MDAITLETGLARLTKRREQLLTTLHHIDDEQDQVERNTDWVDEAAFDSRVALLDSLRHDYHEELSRIEGALGRIDKHQYGICTACHNAIDAKRLELVPETEFCYGCESVREGLELFAA
jgi:DnaK suppressor protein